jgi:hypothetical protein
MRITCENEEFDRLSCGECGIVFYAPSAWVTRRRDHGEHGRAFCCPNGHGRAWGESTLDAVRRERDRLKQQTARLEDERKEAEDRAKKAEANAKRIKKRAVAALCPCCNRHFNQLEAHMKRKHPEVVKLPTRKIA